MKTLKTILITGTTSGIGRSFLEFYSKQNRQIISINQRAVPELVEQFPRTLFLVADIADYVQVKAILSQLEKEGFRPDLLILNAGINRFDNWQGLDWDTYQKVMRTNLDGVMTFLGAAKELSWRDITFLGMSSTSNIVANPAHLGYHLSKLAILKSFQLIQKNDPSNTYKTVVLGPVHTNIMSGYDKPQGLQGKIFEFLAITSNEFVQVADKFLLSTKNNLNYPTHAYLFYQLIKLLLCFVPGIYKGSVTKSLENKN